MGRAEIEHAVESLQNHGISPGPQQLVESMRRLVGQLDLDRLDSIAEYDQVGAMKPASPKLGGEDPLALRALAREDLPLGEDLAARPLDPRGDVGNDRRVEYARRGEAGEG